MKTAAEQFNAAYMAKMRSGDGELPDVESAIQTAARDISFRFNMLLIQQPVTTKLFKKWSRISKRKGGYILVCTITH